MNIEDIVPELFEKKTYYCQRCLNHSKYEERKGHKPNCPYMNCPCSLCVMVERRRQLSNRLLEMENGGSHRPEGQSSKANQPSRRSPSTDDCGKKSGERKPNCQRCAQHGIVARLKGHKSSCPFKTCCCAKCQVVVERQKLMADQIKLRRQQKREKTRLAQGMRETEQSSPEPAENAASICNSCTQQALTYQQLISCLDPSLAADPILTLAAILQVCPHRP